MNNTRNDINLRTCTKCGSAKLLITEHYSVPRACDESCVKIYIRCMACYHFTVLPVD